VRHRSLHRSLRDESGQTLLELLDVLAILGIVVGMAALVLSVSIGESNQIREHSTLQTEVRATIDTMAREIRQAYSGDSSYPVEVAAGTTLQFLSPDRADVFHLRRIAYRLAGGAVQRAQTTSANTDGPPWTGFAWASFSSIPASSWATRVGSVRNAAVFTYFDKSGNQLTGTIDPTAVYGVRITVTVATDTAKTRQFTYSTMASLRWAPA
jgi:type II secretory pathway pseudopilin PulG